MGIISACGNRLRWTVTALAVLSPLAVGPAAAEVIYWNGTTTPGNVWSDVNAWSTTTGAMLPPPIAPPGASDDVVFNVSTDNSNRTVRLNGAQSALSILFRSTGTTTLLGGTDGTPANDTLTIGAGGITLQAGAGAVTIGSGTSPGQVAFALAASQTWTNSSSSLFTVANGISRATGDATNRTLTIAGSGNTTLDGVIANGGVSGTLGLTKAGNGTLTLTAASTFSGTTTISGGTFTLSGAAGAVGSTSGIALFGTGSLTLSNTAAANNTNRLNNAAALTATGGTFNFTHDAAAATNYAETIGALSLAGGAFRANLSQAVTGQTSAVTAASWARSAGGTALFTGTGLGVDTRNQFLLTTAPTMTNSVLQGAVHLNGTTYSLATHGLNGIAALASTNTAETAWAATINARPTADVTVTAPRSLNSLVLDTGIDLLAPAADRTITFTNGSGTILQTSGTSVISTASNFEYILAFGTGEGVFHTYGTLTFNRGDAAAQITGSGGITKAGTGTLNLTTVPSSNTGPVRINQGILQVNAVANANSAAAGTLGQSTNAAANLVLNGGTLRLGTATTAQSTDRLFTLGLGGGTLDSTAGAGGSLAFTNTGSLALLGAGPRTLGLAGTTAGSLAAAIGDDVGGATSLAKSGANTWTLTGTSTFTGSTTISAGTLVAGANAALGTSPVTITSTGALQVAAGITIPNAVTYSGAWNTAGTGPVKGPASGTATISGPLAFTANAAAGGLVDGGTGLTLSGPISATGVTNGSWSIRAGTVTLSNATGNSYSTLLATGTLNLGVANAIPAGATLGLAPSGATTFNLANFDQTIANLTLGTAAQVATINAATGVLTVTGTVRNALDSTATQVINGNLALPAGGTIFDIDSGATGSDVTVNALVTGVGLTKNGVGVLALGGANTYAGVTRINAGVVAATTMANGGSPSAIGQSTTAAPNLVLDGGTLRLATATTAQSTDRLFTLGAAGGTLDSSAGTGGSLAFTNSGAVAFSGSGGRALTLTGTTAGSLAAALGDGTGGVTGVTKTGANTWTLSGINAATGPTTVSAGTLTFATPASLYNNTPASWTSANITVASGAVLGVGMGGVGQFVSDDVAALVTSVNTGFAGGSALGVDVSGSNTAALAANVANTNGGANTIGLVKLGSGSLTLSGANTYTGNTIVIGGTLNITGSITGTTGTNGSRLDYGTTAGATVVNHSGSLTAWVLRGADVVGAVSVFNQTAGTVTIVPQNSADQQWVARSGYGALNITGGTFNTGRFDGVAPTGTNGVAVMYVGGAGTLNQNVGDWFLPIRTNGTMSLTVAPGGTFTRQAAVTSPFSIIGLDGTNSYGVFNVAGGFVDTGPTRGINFSSGFNPGTGNVGFVNAAGGTLAMGANIGVGNAAGSTSAFLNFAGATVRANAALTSLIPASTANYTFTSTIFGPVDNSAALGNASQNFTGGLVVDTNTFAVTIGTPLVAASGVGVTQANITIPAVGNSGYVAAPFVRFSAPAAAGGVPAAGYAVVTNGQVTGIVITAPGTYAAGEQPTITLTGGGGSIAAFQTSALATANAAGGLTKAGAGTLTLSGVNTYGGTTTINAGTLAIASTANLPGWNVDGRWSVAAGATLAVPNAVVDADVATILGSTNFNAGGLFGFDTAAANRTYPTAITGVMGLAKLGTNALTLSADNTYSGPTTITAGTLNVGAGGTTGTLGAGAVANAGTLILNRSNSYSLAAGNLVTGAGTVTLGGGITVVAAADNQFATTGPLNFGLANAAANANSLDLSAGTGSFGAVLVRTNNAAANTVTVGAGKTFAITGLSMGYDAGSGTGATASNLTVTGGGSMTLTNPAATVAVSVNQAATNALYWSTATLNLAGLGGFSADVGTFNVGVGTTTTGVGSVLLSDTANTITATTLQIGNSGGNNGNGNSTVTLGTGTNAINVDTLNIGFGKVGGSLRFASSAVGPGTVTIGGKTAATANIVLGSNNGTATGGVFTGDLDLRGHSATVTAGSLQLGIGSNTGTGSTTGQVQFDAGTFTVNSVVLGSKSGTAGSGTATGTIAIGGGTFTVNAGGSFAMAGNTAATGTAVGNLTVTGSGLFTSNVALTKTGGTNTTATVTLNGPTATIDMLGNPVGSATQTIALSAQQGTLQNLSQLNGGGTLTKTGAGTLTLAGVNTFTGDLAINAGTLLLGTSTGLNSTAGSENAIVFGAGSTGTLTLNGFSETVKSLATNASPGTPVIQNGAVTDVTLTVGNSANASGSYAGTIQDGAGGGKLAIVKLGGGTLALGGTNTYTGGTTVTTGALTLDSALALPGVTTAAAWSVASGGTLAIGNATAVTLLGQLEATGNLAPGGLLGFDTTGGNRTVPDSLTLTTGLAKIGANTLVLSGTNAVTGGFRTVAGTLQFNAPAATGGAPLTVAGGSTSFAFDGTGGAAGSGGNGTGALQTIDFNSGVAVVGDGTLVVGRLVGYGTTYATALNKTAELDTLSLGGNTLTVSNNNGYGALFSGATTLTAAGTLNVASATASNVVQGLTLAGPVSGASGLTKSGNGTLLLSNATNAFTGNLAVTAGRLAATSDAALGDSANQVVLSNNAGLRAAATFSSARTIQLASGTNVVEALPAATLTLTTAFAGASATTKVTKADAGTLVLATPGNASWGGSITAAGASAQVLTGGLQIDQGAVQLGDDDALGGATNIVAIGSLTGAAVQLTGGRTIPNPLALNIGTTAAGATGFYGGFGGLGVLQSLSGTNTWSGQLSLNHDQGIGAGTGSTLNLTGGAVLNNHILALLGGGTINISGTGLTGVQGVYKLGAGTTNVTTSIAAPSANGVRLYGGGGAMVLSGSAAVGANTANVEVYGGDTLVLDNSGTNVVNRLGGTSPLNLTDGTIRLVANGSVAMSEAFGVLGSVWGGNTLRVDTSAAASTIAFSSISGSKLGGGSVLAFRSGGTGADFGTASNTVSFTTAPTLVASVIPAVVTSDSAGTNFATYSSGSIRAFTGYATGNDLTTVAATATPRLTATTPATTRTLNALAFGSTATLSAAAGTPTVSLTAGNILVQSGTATIPAGVVVQSAAGTTYDYTLNVADGASLNVAGALVSAYNLTKGLGGSLTFSARQYFNTATSAFTLTGGTTTLAGGDHTLFPGQGVTANTQSFAIGPAATLDLGGTTQLFGYVRSPNNNAYAGSGGVITSATPAVLVSRAINGTTENFGGRITGPVTYVQASTANTRNFYADNTYTGATVITGGTLQLIDDARLSGTSGISLNYGSLTLNNRGTLDLGDRIPDATPLTMRGGRLEFLGRVNAVSAESIGPVTLAGGVNQISNGIGSLTGGVNASDVTIAGLGRPGGSAATMLFRVSSGTLGLIGNAARTTITAAPPLTNNLIGPWAMASREWASYVPGLGVGQLNAAGFPGYDATTLAAGSNPSQNVRLTAGTTLTGDATVNTLAVNYTASPTVALGGFTLTAAGGGILLASGTDNTTATISGGTLTAGSQTVGGDLYLNFLPYSFTTTARKAVVSAAVADNAGGPVRLVVSTSDDTSSTLGNTVTLSGANTYTGGTVLNAAQVVLGGGAGTVVIPAGGLTLNNSSVTMQTNAGQIAASTIPTLEGGSSLTLVGANTLAGMVFDNRGGTATPTLATGGVLTLTGGITASSMNVATMATITGTVDFAAAARTITVNPVSYEGRGLNPWVASLSVDALVQNAGPLTVTGGGVLRLNNTTSTFAGGYAIDPGTAVIVAQSSTPSTVGATVTAGPLGTGPLTLGANARLMAGGTFTVANPVTALGGFTFDGIQSLTINGAFSLPAAGTPTIDVPVPQGSLTIGGAISGAGTSLTKAGYGLLGLTSANTFDGGLVLSAGTLSLGNAAALGSGPLTLAGGNLDSSVASLALSTNNAQTWSGNFQFVGTQSLNLGAGAVSLTGDRTVAVLANTLTVGGGIGDSGGNRSLTKLGNGTLFLGGANTYGGPTAISAGTVVFGQQSSLYNNTPASWTSTNLTVASGATAVFDVGGTGEFTSSDIGTIAAMGTATGGFLGGSTLALDTVNAAGGTFTLAAPVADTNGGANQISFVKRGTGTLVLSAANTFTGPTSLAAGTLTLANALALQNTTLTPAASTSLVFDQSVAGNAFTIGAISGAVAVALQNNAATPAGITLSVGGNNATTTYSGVLSGPGSLTKTGTGTLTLSGTNTYLGTTTVSGGSITVNGAASLGGTPAAATPGNIVLDGGMIVSTAGAELIFAANKGLRVDAGGGTLLHNAVRLQFSGIIAGPGSLAISGTGAGDVNLANAANTYAGGTTLLPGGRLPVASNSTPASGTVTAGPIGTGTLTLAGGQIRAGTGANYSLGNVVRVTANTTFYSSAAGTDRDLIFNGTATLVGGTRTFTVDTSVTAGSTGIFFNGPMGDEGNGYGVTKAGAGTLVFGGTNTYSGPTVVQAGTLAFGKRASLYDADPAAWTTANLSVASGSTVAFNVGGPGEFTPADFETLSGLGSATAGLLGGSSIGLDTTGATGTVTYAPVLANPNGGANAIGFAKRGTGTLVLSATNTYSGNTAVLGGTLSVASDANLGAGSAISLGGGRLAITGESAFTTTKTVTLTANSELDVANTAGASIGALSGAFTLTKVGAGTLTLPAATNSLAGFNLNGGSLALGATSNLTLNNAGGNSLQSTGGGTISGGTLTLGAVSDNWGTANGTTLTISSRISGVTANTFEAFATANGTGVLVLANAANNFAGTMQINSGTVSVATIGNSGVASHIGAGSTIGIGSSSTSTGRLTYTGTGGTTNRVINLSGTTAGATVEQAGTGLLRFTAALTATGAGAKTFTLTGSSAGIGELAGAVVENSTTNKTTLTKTGTGRWVLSGASTYTGNTNVDGGVMQFSTGATTATPKLLVGYGAGKSAGVIQDAGVSLSIATTTGSADVLTIGATGGYGYYLNAGGTLAVGQLSLVGNSAGVGSTGVFEQNGGSTAVAQGAANGWIVYGWTGTDANGVLNVRDGAVYNGSTTNDTTMAYVANANAMGMLNLLGPSAVMDATGGAATPFSGTARGVQLARFGGNFGSWLNLNGGTLTANFVAAASAHTPTFVGFDGGRLRANSASSSFLQNLTSAIVYDGGATIDTNGFNVTVAQPLLASAGNGVASIPVTDGGSGYVGAPAVRISGGGGSGASAVAVVDLNPASGTFGRVTSIQVTSHGSGYTSAPTVTLLGGGAATPATVGTPVTAVAGSGGLTKAGAGRLTLWGANTYTGATAIAGGSVLFPTRSSLGGGDVAAFTAATFSVATGGTAAFRVGGATGFTAADIATLSGLGSATGGFGNNSTLELDVVAATSLTAPLVNTNGGANVVSLVKTGSAALTLTGANTYSGGTTIVAGAVTVPAGSTVNGTTGTSLAFTGSGRFTATPADGVTQGMGALTFTAGNGVVESTWAGTGVSTMAFSSLAARGATATGNFVSAGGVNGTDNRITLTGQATGFIDQRLFFGGNAFAWYDATGFVRGLVYDGTEGTTTAGGTSVTGTHVQVTGAVTGQTTGTFSTLAFTTNSAFTLAATQTVTVNGLLKSGGAAGGTISGGSGIQAASGQALVVRTDAAADTLTIGTPILANGASSLVKTGAGTLTLNATAVNTFTGGTFLNEGVLVAAQDSNLGSTAASNPITFAGGTLRASAAITLNANHGLVVGLGGGEINSTGSTITLGTANMLSGSGTLRITGNAATTTVLQVNAANASFTGGIEILSGRVRAEAASTTNPFGTGDITVGAGNSSFWINGGTSTFGNRFLIQGDGGENRGVIRLTGGGTTLNGPIVLAGDASLLADAAVTTTFSGPISGDFGVFFGSQTGGTRTNANTTAVYLVNGNNSQAATRIGAGILSISSERALGATAAPLTIDTGTLRANGPAIVLNSARTVTLAAGTTSLIDTNGNALRIDGPIAASSGSLTKIGTGTLTLAGTVGHTGATTIEAGSLVVSGTPATGTALTLGAAAGTAVVRAEYAGVDATYGSLTVPTNSTSFNEFSVSAGRTLTINGSVLIGTDTNASTTRLRGVGGGAVVVSGSPANFTLGGATGGTNDNVVSADFAALASFTANLGTGTFRMGDVNTGTEVNPTTFLLAASNTITAAAVRVGDGVGGDAVHALTLGSGTNLLNANTISVGSAGAVGRSSGQIAFGGSDTTGTIRIRGSNGLDRATVNLVNTSTSTAINISGTMDFAGHAADILAGTMTMATRSFNTGAATGTFTFNQGTFDVTSLAMAQRTGTGTGNATATVTLGGGTSTIGSLVMAVNTSAGGTSTGTFSVSGGSVTIGTGLGTAIDMANAAASRTAVSNLNVSGGTVSLLGNLIRTGGAGTETATIALSGGTLDLGNYAIGSGTAPITLTATGGTLRNVLSLNGTGGLTKTGPGLLRLEGTNAWTGGVTLSAGTLEAATAAALGTGNVTVASGGLLRLRETPGLGAGNSIFLPTGANLEVASGVAAALTEFSNLAGWSTLPSIGRGTVGDLLYGTVLAGGTTLSSSWSADAAFEEQYSDVLSLSGTGAGNPFVLSMSYDVSTPSAILASLNIYRRPGTTGPFAPLGTSFVGVGTSWTSAFTTVGQYGVDTTNQTVWVVSDTNSQFVIVPEPGTLAVVAAAAGIGLALRRRLRRAA